MAHLVLSRKYRPQRFEDLVGQEHVAATLSNAIHSGRIGHAYLFVGPRGTGKTTTARIFAKALNCAGGPTATPCGTCDSCVGVTSGNDLDVVEMDAASNNSVDDVRALRDSVGYRPARSRFRVWIVDEVHMLSVAAFNAFLKTLEEPPPQAKFLFCTTEAHKLPETFLSRVQRLEFRRIDAPKMAERLAALAAREGIGLEAGVVDRIAAGALGGLRDAESLLEQLLASAVDGRVTLADLDAVTGRAPAERVGAVMGALLAGDAAAALDAAGACLDAGGKPDTVLEQWVEAFRALLVRAARARAAPRGPGEPDVATRWGLPRVARSLDLLLEKRRHLRDGADGRLVVELTAVELARLPSARDLDALVEALRVDGPRGPVGGGGPSGTAAAAAPRAAAPAWGAGASASGPGDPGRPLPVFSRTGGGGAPAGGPSSPGPSSSGSVGPGSGGPGSGAGASGSPRAEAPSAPPPTSEVARARWGEFVAVAGRDRRLGTALGKARPLGVEGDALVLVVPAEDVVTRNLLRDRNALEALRAAATTTFGAPLRIALLDPTEAAARGPVGGAPAAGGGAAPAAAPATSGPGPGPDRGSAPASGGGPGSGGVAGSGGPPGSGGAPGSVPGRGRVEGSAGAPPTVGLAVDEVRRLPEVAAVLDELGGRLVAVERLEPRDEPPKTGG